MCKTQNWIATLVTAGVVMAAAPAAASPLTFTWNPAGASPAFGGSAFTADTIYSSESLRSVVDLGDSTFVARRLATITGFTLNGSPVAAAGLGSNYGLYFDFTDTGFNPVPTLVRLTSISFTLKADPGNRNGAALATAGGIGFANTGPSGEADDIVLASGAMAASSATLDLATGMRDVPDVDTFAPAAGQAGFFRGGSDRLLFFGFGLPDFVNVFQPEGTLITLYNDQAGAAQFTVPEPGSVLLLAVGLLGLLPLLRRG